MTGLPLPSFYTFKSQKSLQKWFFPSFFLEFICCLFQLSCKSHSAKILTVCCLILLSCFIRHLTTLFHIYLTILLCWTTPGNLSYIYFILPVLLHSSMSSSSSSGNSSSSKPHPSLAYFSSTPDLRKPSGLIIKRGKTLWTAEQCTG